MLDMIKTHLIPRSEYPDDDDSKYNGRYLSQSEYDIQNSTECSSTLKKEKLKEEEKLKQI